MANKLVEKLRTDLDDSYQPTFLSLVEKCSNEDMKNLAVIIVRFYFSNNPPKKNAKLPHDCKPLYKGVGYLANLNSIPLALRKQLYAYVDHVIGSTVVEAK